MTARAPLYQSAGIQREVPATDTLNVAGCRIIEADIGNGSTTSFPVSHNWGRNPVSVEVYLVSTKQQVVPDVYFTDTNTVTLVFGTAPTTNQYHYVIQG